LGAEERAVIMTMKADQRSNTEIAQVLSHPIFAPPLLAREHAYGG